MLSASIAAFEVRYQLRNPVFWVSVAIFFLLGFGIAASSNLSIGTPRSVHENSPFAVTNALALLGMFYLFVITSFVANAVVRDDATGFGPMIRATPVGRSSFLAGRFAGGLIIAIIGFAAVPLGIGIGCLMPWVDPERVGPGGLTTYAWPFLVIAIPNLILSSALLFSLATIARSMLASYIGVLVLVMGYLTVAAVLGNQPQYQDAIARLEPMALGAIGDATRYWTAADMNTRLIPLEGNLLINRLIALGWSLLFLALAWARFSMTERAPSRWRQRRLARQARRAATAAAVHPRSLARPVGRSFGLVHGLGTFRSRLKIETLQVLKSPGLIVLALIALAFTMFNLVFAQTLYGTPSYPLTARIITLVGDSTSLFTLIVAVFYGGELVWRERDVKINEIVDAAPVAGWAMLVPKIVAITLVLLSMSLAGMLAGVLYQLLHHAPTIDLGMYLVAYVVPQSARMLLIAVLAVVLQVLSPNKYVGWALMLVWFVSRIFLGNLGYSDMLYRYGGGPDDPLSDMNGIGNFWIGALIALGYWLAAALLLLVLAHWLWPRGTVVAVRPRLLGMARRVTLGSGMTALAAIAAMAGTGLVIHHNTHVLNPYETMDERDARTAEYERRYLRYERLPRPVVTDVEFAVAIHPDQRRLDASGHYNLRNDSGAPITEVHVRQGDETALFSRLDIAGARLVRHDREQAYRIYRFATPLLPGATTRLDFASRIWRRGFANGKAETDLVDNGTFISNAAFAPVIGMDRRGLLQDRTKRRQQGLPDEVHPAALEDTGAQALSYVHADWVNARITVSTAADQVPVAPGNKVSDVVKDGRRTAVFVSPAPILNFFSVQSARYAVAQDRFSGVRLAVYHDPRHGWNVPAMLRAMKVSLAYYTRNFGPYQFDYARIVEFPGYAQFAQAFAGTIPYSEEIGFAADVRDPETIDYVTYVTAHEMGHQYWAHQVIGADMQGATLLSETLAQYSALMVMQKVYGPDKIRRFLKYELDLYLAARKSDVLAEQPLVRVEDQQHIHYRKGSLVMYLLQQRLGEAAVNRALARVIARFRFKGAPYPRSLDLIAELRKEARTAAQQDLISDLFERITIYDLKVKDAVTRRTAQGQWATRVTIAAAKFSADGKGRETATRLAEPIEVGLFTARPGTGAFDKADVLAMTLHPIRTGQQVIELVTAAKPLYAGVDPYNFYIDRDSDDNLAAVN